MEDPEIPINPIVRISRSSLMRGVGVSILLTASIAGMLTSNLPTGETLGRLSAPILTGLLVAAISATLTKHARNRRFFDIWLGMAVTFALLGLLSKARSVSSTALTNAPSVQTDIDAHMRGVFAQKAQSGDEFQSQRQMIEAMRWAERRSVGRSANFYRAVGDARREELTTSETLQTSLSRLDLRETPVNAPLFDSKDQLNTTATELQRARVSIVKMIGDATTRTERYGQRLSERDADPGLSRGFLKTLPRATEDELGNLDKLKTALELNIVLVALLQRTWGTWSRESTAAGFKFSEPSSQRAFETALAELRKHLAAEK